MGLLAPLYSACATTFAVVLLFYFCPLFFGTLRGGAKILKWKNPQLSSLNVSIQYKLKSTENRTCSFSQIHPILLNQP